jgi:hypothetical protein
LESSGPFAAPPFRLAEFMRDAEWRISDNGIDWANRGQNLAAIPEIQIAIPYDFSAQIDPRFHPEIRSKVYLKSGGNARRFPYQIRKAEK